MYCCHRRTFITDEDQYVTDKPQNIDSLLLQLCLNGPWHSLQYLCCTDKFAKMQVLNFCIRNVGNDINIFNLKVITPHCCDTSLFLSLYIFYIYLYHPLPFRVILLHVTWLWSGPANIERRGRHDPVTQHRPLVTNNCSFWPNFTPGAGLVSTIISVHDAHCAHTSSLAHMHSLDLILILHRNICFILNLNPTFERIKVSRTQHELSKEMHK